MDTEPTHTEGQLCSAAWYLICPKHLVWSNISHRPRRILFSGWRGILWARGVGGEDTYRCRHIRRRLEWKKLNLIKVFLERRWGKLPFDIILWLTTECRYRKNFILSSNVSYVTLGHFPHWCSGTMIPALLDNYKDLNERSVNMWAQRLLHKRC